MHTTTHIHATAVADAVDIGEGTRIWAFSHVMKGASIGTNCNIGDHCFIESGVRVGSNVTIKNGNQLWRGITLEDGVFVGPNVTFTNDLYPRSPRLPAAGVRYANSNWLCPTLVKQGASVGGGAIIIAGNVIGSFAMVGAGSIVTRTVPEHALVVGVPARVVGWVCECGRRLKCGVPAISCDECGLEFSKFHDLIRKK